jgi:hypothetical protein
MATKAQKMTELAITVQPSVNFANGATKKPDAVILTAIAAGQSVLSVLPLFTFKGYSLRIASYQPEKITLLVFDQITTDKETKVKTTTSIMREVELTLGQFAAWQANSLFDSSTAAKLALQVAKKLADYPLVLLADHGLFPKDRIIPVLSSVLSAKYDMDQVSSDQTATAIMHYVTSKPALTTQPLAKILSYVESEAMQQSRRKEFDAKKAQKQLAAAPLTNDQF